MSSVYRYKQWSEIDAICPPVQMLELFELKVGVNVWKNSL